jgi:outer membrane protein assembly factor BamA
MKIILFIIIVLPLFLKAQSMAPDHTQTLGASEFNPNDLIMDQIECVGNETTSCDLIQKEVYLNPGDKINEEELSNTKIRLKVKNLFSSVNIFLKKGSERGHVNVVIEVQETNPLYTELEFGATRVNDETGEHTGYGLSAGLGHRNLFGVGKVLQAKVNVSDVNSDVNKSYSIDLNYFDPHVFGSKKTFFGLTVNHSYHPYAADQLDKDILFYGSNYQINSLRNLTNINSTLGYRIFDFSYISLGTHKSFGSYLRFDAYTDERISPKTYESESTSINYGWNSEDDTYFATEGSRLNLGFTKYPTQDSGFDYFALNFQKNWNWNRKHILTLGTYEGFEDFSEKVLGKFGSRTLFKYGYQFDSNVDADINKGRWYFGVNPSYSSIQGTDLSWETGVLLEHKKYGILKLSFTNWSVR